MNSQRWLSQIVACLCILPGTLWGIDLKLKRVTDRQDIVDIANAGDGSGRLFLVERAGRIFVLEDGVELQTPFLDISEQVSTTGPEQGLFSVAFAPDHEVSGLFYVWYTNLSGDTVLDRFSVGPDPNVADPDSRDEIGVVSQPRDNHNGGRLRFGPDGMLYLGLGDGGGPNDNAQSGNTLLGKLVRIDVDPRHGSYAVPPDNPFVGDAEVRDEIWAFGLRNPWRISFDPETGDLYIADVGEDSWEEVNFQPASSNGGENYGWPIIEGRKCVEDGCSKRGLVRPVAQYAHGTRHCSITGGEVYRGQAYPDLVGTYLFGDFCSGRIWGLTRDGDEWQRVKLRGTKLRITSFGLGEDRSVYVAGSNLGVYLISDGPVQPESGFQINSGLSDSWFNPATPGQGFFVTVYPDSGEILLAWFTYDTERPPENVEANLGGPGQRWLTAFGPYAGNTGVLDIEVTRGGEFDTAQPAPVQQRDGTIVLEFDGCNSGRVIYDITSAGLQGTIPIERLSSDNVPLCEAAQ